MDLLSKGQISESFADLFNRYWPNKAKAIAEATSLAADFRRATNQVESVIGNRLAGQYEFLGTRRLGMTYLTLVYLQKHHYGALPLAFLFYKGQKGWFINNTAVGDGAKPDQVSLVEAGLVWPELEPLKQATDDCMRFLSQGHPSEGFAGLFKRYYPFKEQAQTNADSTAASFQTAVGKQLSGRYEFVGTIRLGHTYATLVYVQKLERGALMVGFTFHRGAQDWLVVKTFWADGDKVDALLWATEAETLSPEVGSLKQATDRCMSSLSNGVIGEAFTNLYQGYWPDKEEANSKAEELTMKIRHLGNQYRFNIGKRLPGEYEFIGARRLGSTYVNLFYVQKHEFGASPVSFGFYKGAQNWVLTSSAWGVEAEPDKVLWTDKIKRRSPEIDSIKQTVDQCMASLSNGETFPGLTNLTQRYWAVEEEAIPKAEALSTTLQGGIKEMEPFIGKPLGGQYELEGIRCLGTSYAVMVYILKHEYGGFSVRLEFGKGQSKWYLRDIHMENDPQSAIELFSFAERAK